MRERYTIAALAAALQVDTNTLRAWLDKAGIVAQVDKRDVRKKWITDEDAQHLAELHEIALLDIPDPLPTTLQAAHKRILQLEHENMLLRASQVTQRPSDAFKRDSERATPRRTYLTTSSSRPGLPHGWQSLTGFCAAQGIPLSTVEKAITSGRLPAPHHGEWQEGRAIVRNALDDEMQSAIVAMYGEA